MNTRENNQKARKYDVFLCHNSQDKPEVKAIAEKLTERGIIPWLDEWNIKAGQIWPDELDKQIKNVKTVAVFIGPNGIGPWQNDEINVFLLECKERNCLIIPVFLKNYQGTPDIPSFLKIRQNVDFRKNSPDPIGNLVEAIEEKEDYISICPYVGLLPFRERHEKLFFGRESFIEKLVTVVQEYPIVSVIGPSGCGKSSVVFAGLIPRLRKQENWLITHFTPRLNPFHELAKSLEKLIEDEQTKIKQEDVIDRTLASLFNKSANIQTQIEKLRRGNGSLEDTIQSILSDKPDKQVLIVVDQFEELYTLRQNENERRQFLQKLFSVNHLKNHQESLLFKIVFILRADFMGKALYEPEFSNIFQSFTSQQFLGATLSYEELKGVIEKPAERVRLQIESGLTEKILDSVQKESGDLPLLEFTLTLLWEHQTNGQLTIEAYDREIQSVGKVLARYADRWYKVLTSQEKIWLQQSILQLVQPGKGTEDTRRIARKKDLKEELWEFARTTLARSRLVMVQEDGTLSLAHEAIMREWPRLQEWIDAEREFRIWQEELRAAIERWERVKQNAEALLRGVMLIEAEKWKENKQDILTELESTFISKSSEYSQAEQQKRKNLYQKANTYAIEALLQNSQNLANSFELLKSLLYVVKAGKLLQQTEVPLPLYYQVLCHLRNCVEAFSPAAELKGHLNTVNQIVFHPEGHLLAAASWDKSVKLWDVTQQRAILTLENNSEAIHSLNFNPEGTLLATGHQNNIIHLWQIPDGQKYKTLRKTAAFVKSLDVSSDGNYIVSGGWKHNIQLWDIQQRKEWQTFSGHTADVTATAFHPERNLFASGSLDCTVKIWDSKRNQVLSNLGEHPTPVTVLSFNPTGTYLASGSRDGTIILWDFDEERELGIWQADLGAVTCLAFHPDGNMLASAHHDGTIVFWNIQDPQNISQSDSLQKHSASVTGLLFVSDGSVLVSGGLGLENSLILTPLDSVDNSIPLKQNMSITCLDISHDGEFVVFGSVDGTITLRSIKDVLQSPQTFSSPTTAAVRTVKFTSDDRLLLSRGDDYTIRVWDVATGKLETSLNANDTPSIKSLCFSPDKQNLAAGSSDHSITLWDVGTFTEQQTIDHHQGAINCLDFSSDGNMLASGGEDTDITLWNAKNCQQLASLQGHNSAVNCLKFSNDRKYLVSGSSDKTLRLWDIEKCEEIATLQGHASAVRSLCINAQGTLLVSGGFDNTIKLWDLSTQAEITTLRGHTQYVSSVALNRANTLLASASYDKTIKLWNFDLKDLLTCACDILRKEENPPFELKQEIQAVCDEMLNNINS